MDKYAVHIAELNALEGEQQLQGIRRDWLNGKGIFQFLCKEGSTNKGDWSKRPNNIGCPSMIRASYVNESTFKYRAETESLTVAAQNEERLPLDSGDIRPVHFEVFAQLQRQADIELGRL